MIRLFHVSDVHFGREDSAATEWFAETVRNEAPDALVVTGDLTMRARPAEFAAAARWLQHLDRPTTVEVGNHDLPYFDLFARFLTPYRRFHALERMIEKPLDIPGVTIIPLKTTARFQWRLNWSKGYVSRHALQQALALAEGTTIEGVKFVACHHPLIEAGTRMDGRTRRGAEALSELAAAGVDAVLTGHVHDPFDVPYRVGGRTVRLIGAGTLSERTRASRPSFNEIRVDGRAFETVARMLD